MLLYTEKQLGIAYNIYRMHQIGQGLSFMELENFRRLYEELLEEVYDVPIWNYNYARFYSIE